MTYVVVVRCPIYEDIEVYGPYTYEEAAVVLHAVNLENRVQRPMPSASIQELVEFGDDTAAA